MTLEEFSVELGIARWNDLEFVPLRTFKEDQMIRILPDRVRELYEVPDGHERVTALTIGRFINRTSVGRGISRTWNTGTNPVFLFKFTTFGDCTHATNTPLHSKEGK